MATGQVEITNMPVPPAEQREIEELYAKLQQLEAKLIGPNGKTEVLPNNLYSFLCGLLADLKAGYSVTILQGKAELTTVDAGKLLGMSRQFLIKLLDKGEIPFHMVGTHRRLYARHVLAYKAKRDTVRRKALDDLARDEYQEGRYNIPDDSNAGQ
ncbi:MAG: excisionase family DNA-binding protein [Terriglobia bacterium]